MNINDRPKAKLIGEDGNIFNLMGIASRVLNDEGYEKEAREMFKRITIEAQSYEEALSIISEYVEPVGEEEMEFDMKGYD